MRRHSRAKVDAKSGWVTKVSSVWNEMGQQQINQIFDP